ncbi:MAG: hypothetical protein M1827_001448 [Pycnora praestabilis]|nr:MAG: hypothetical protein M1827_001448 [Pycnora praestabilis]
MSLGDFLTDSTLGSWADEMEDMPLAYPVAIDWGYETFVHYLTRTGTRTGYGGDRGSAGGFGSGFTDRGGYSVREQLPLPDKPPYTTHIGNLSFDATEGDIQDFFSGCAVTSVRIVEDKLERKPKGFGYVEYGTIDGLKKALDLNGSQFQGRNIRVSVAEPQKDRPDAREFGDWTRKGPLADIPGQRRVSDRGGFAIRNVDNGSDAGSDRGDRRRAPFEQGDGKLRDFGNWERKGPLSPAMHSGPPSREGGRQGTNDSSRDRRQSPAWGEGRSQEGSRPPRREFQERPPVDRAPTAPDMDNQWRSKMRPDAPAKSPIPSQDVSTPPSPAAHSAATVRPRLNLQKRTVSEAEPTASSPPSATPDAKASPFGAARPIDTFAREKEIEEKRQLATREKKDLDDKIREEKRLAKEAVKDAAKADKAAENIPGQDEKENEIEKSQPGKNFEILRKAAEEENVEADEEADVEDQNGTVIEDKAIKPKDLVRDIPTKKPEGNAWRKQSDNKAAETPTEPSADTLEEDGWSTVSKPRNGRRGGNQAARALAS